jgi:hypothetical protein
MHGLVGTHGSKMEQPSQTPDDPGDFGRARGALVGKPEAWPQCRLRSCLGPLSQMPYYLEAVSWKPLGHGKIPVKPYLLSHMKQIDCHSRIR